MYPSVAELPAVQMVRLEQRPGANTPYGVTVIQGIDEERGLGMLSAWSNSGASV